METKLRARSATPSDIEAFIPRMRQEDNAECRALLGCDAGDALRAMFRLSERCLVGENNGEVFCLFGCIPDNDGARLWMLFVDGLQSLPVSFYRISRQYVSDMLKDYAYLQNYVAIENEWIIKWVTWLGFKLGGPQEINGQIYRLFWRGR